MFEISFEDTIFEDKNHEELVIFGYESTCEKEGLTDGIICKKLFDSFSRTKNNS